jgi:CobQ-like glutamine amidotransferase family enzyme
VASENKTISIAQLYPQDMNMYGDNGNVLTLQRRLEWYGFTPVVVQYNRGDRFPQTVDIVVGGGGQDSGQKVVQSDLAGIGAHLRALAEDNTPMLAVCGLYQLFGHFFETFSGTRIQGIGVLDIETYGKNERLIGNVTAESDEFGQIIGYENHSGQTYLGNGVRPLATVRRGAGNNLNDAHEGARYRHVIGTYLHGSLLPKNPAIADYLIRHAVTKRYGSFAANQIDDRFTEQARKQAMKRPR